MIRTAASINMEEPPYKTRAQQKLEWLESLRRPLTEAEQNDLYRALHADYMRCWRIHKAECEANAQALEKLDLEHVAALGAADEDLHRHEVQEQAA